MAEAGLKKWRVYNGSVGSGKSLINGLVQDDYTIEADVKPWML